MTGVNLGGGSGSDLSSLLKIVGSDSDYGKKISDLVAAEQAAKNATAELRAAQKEIEVSRKQAKSDLERLDAEKEAHEKLTAEFAAHKAIQSAGLDAREADLRNIAAALTDKKSKHDDYVKKTTSQLSTREAAVSLKERELFLMQTKTEQDAKRVNAKMKKMAEAEAI